MEDLEMKDWQLKSIDPSTASGSDLFDQLPKLAPPPSLQHISHPSTHDHSTDVNGPVANSASVITCSMFDIGPPHATFDTSLLSEMPPSLSDIEIPDWLKDEPSWLKNVASHSDSNPKLSSHEGMVGLVDRQEASRMSCFDCPNLHVDDLLWTPTNPKVPALTQATPPSSDSLHHHHHQVAQALNMPINCANELMDVSGLTDRNDGGDCLKPHRLHSGPGSHGWANVSNVAVVQEVQVSRRLEDKGGNLSLEDTKRICLKVSKLQGPHQDPESSSRKASENTDAKVCADKENCIINEMFIRGWTCNKGLSNAEKGSAEHHPRGKFEKFQEYSNSGPWQEFSFLEGLDDNFGNMLHKKNPNYESCNHNLAASSADVRHEGHAPWSSSHLSTSLSPDLSDIFAYLSASDLSTNQLLDQQQAVTSRPEQQAVFGHPQSLELIHAPLGKGSSSQFLMVPHASSLPSLSWGPRTRCFAQPQMLKQECLAKRNRTHSFKLNKALVPPNMNSIEKPLSISPCTIERGSKSITTKDLGSLHWSLAAAKTRAARKRRMGKCHVPNPSSSLRQASTQRLSKSLPLALPNQESKLATQGFQRDALIKPSIEKQTLGSESTMRFLMQKELKPSDVSSLGRIILPKKDAEAKLPQLIAKEGLPLSMQDITTSQTWNLRYRFWPNNKSRMYLIENTRKFVEIHHLREGDFVALYMDDQTGKYFIQAKKFVRLDKASTSCNGKFPNLSFTQERCKEAKHEKIDVDGNLGLNEDVMDEELTDLLRPSLNFTLGLDMNGLPQLEHVPHIEYDMTIDHIFDLEDNATCVK